MKLSEKKAVNIFLNHFVSFRILFVGKGKSFHLASIGQAIMQQLQPNILIVTLKLGLGIQMPQHFGSRFLTDSLNKYGLCVPYKKVLKYELCAAVYKGTKIPVVSESSSAKTTHLMHHVADNANHNPATLEGCNTVYGMSTICSVTPAVSLSLTITQLEDVSTKLDKLIRLTGKEQWRNDIVVKALDFQYRDPVLKTTG